MESDAALKSALEKCHKQDDQMLEQQLKIEELQRALKVGLQPLVLTHLRDIYIYLYMWSYNVSY